ncbi:AtpZ/AtpI family protein [Elusimicrobium minutum]|uniref:AtpZ/AtpI family protein n=1 Tax=Elusimicrobium minutum TaxID=423605 RepID=UPI0001616D29|nr:AtpZ/AtpI family protein [Elusimicrobium minutum]
MNKKDFLISTQLGMQFAITVCLFGGAGYWADKKLGTLPLFLIVLSSVGFAAGLYFIIKAAQEKVQKDDRRDSNPPHHRP